MGSYHKRPLLLRLFWVADGDSFLHFARRRKLFIEEGEWCCAKNNAHLLNRLIAFLSQLLEDVTYPWYRSSPSGRAAVWGGNVGFVNRRGEIFPRSNIVGISPVSWGYIKRPRIVRGTDSIGRLGSCSSYSPPSRGMGFQKLSSRIL